MVSPPMEGVTSVPASRLENRLGQATTVPTMVHLA
jgi:hypothetical protein